jgi:long-chain acyl-CoA synthetase
MTAPPTTAHHPLARVAGDRTPLEMFDERVRELGDAPLLYVFETPLGARAVSRLVDGLAAGLHARGVGRGDRVALFLQNDPQFWIAMLATWRLGATAVPCNPMLRARELTHHLHDADVSALITLDELHTGVLAPAAEEAAWPAVVVTTGAMDLRTATPAPRAVPAGTLDLLTLAAEGDGAPFPRASPGPDDVAVLTYTSGTTGPAKGAMNTHGNVAYASRVYRSLLGVGRDDVVLGIAPLYHVTGLTAHIGLTLASGAPTVLAHRFDAAETGRLIAHHRTTTTVAAITAYMALANDEGARAYDLSSMTKTWSGGAPIPPAAVVDVLARTGMRVRPLYGLTETTGPTHITPAEPDPPAHPETGILSVGRDVPGTSTRILGDDGREVPRGEVGEVCIRGPQVVPGYWRQPAETANALPGGELRTGDVGTMDADGWLYLVDRSKDMIVASGFKVWPREVEDVLYEHPAVREAAVVGVPDGYRGETVWAYVSLRAGAEADEPLLVAHCRERLAAYKYPRVVQILDELPKTTSGKILRRELRDVAHAAAASKEA